MQVTFGQSLEELRVALAARGYTVQGSGTTIRIVRRTATPPTTSAPPSPPGSPG